jgi:hypothetical protein
MTTQASTQTPAATSNGAPAQGGQAAQQQTQQTTPPAPTGQSAQPQATTDGAPAQQQQQQPSPEFRRLALRNRELEKRIKELEGKATKADEYEAKFSALKDPSKKYEALEREFGVTYAEWTEQLLKSGGNAQAAAAALELPPEVAKKLERLDELERKIAEREKIETTAAEQQQLQAARAVVQKLVEGGEGKYQLIGALGQHDAVIRAYREHVQKHGEPLDEADDLRITHEVLGQVEQQIATGVEAQLVSLAKTPKGKALLEKALAALSAGAGTEQQTEPTTTTSKPASNNGSNGNGRPKTVSNDMAAARGDSVDTTRLTRQQLRQRGIEAMRRAGKQ